MKKTKEYLENRIKKLTDERKKCVSKYNSNNRSEPQTTKETIQRAYNAPQNVV